MPQATTERLKIITFELEMIKALLEGPEQLVEIVPYQVPAEYPMDVYKQFFPYKIERFTQQPEENIWEGLIIHKRPKRSLATSAIKADQTIKGKSIWATAFSRGSRAMAMQQKRPL